MKNWVKVIFLMLSLSACVSEKSYTPPANITDRYSKITVTNRDSPMYVNYFEDPVKCQGRVLLTKYPHAIGPTSPFVLYLEKNKAATLMAHMQYVTTEGLKQTTRYCNAITTFTPTQDAYVIDYRVDYSELTCGVTAAVVHDGALTPLSAEEFVEREIVLPTSVDKPWCATGNL